MTDLIPGAEALQRWAVMAAIGAALFATGFVKGCQHEQADQVIAETKFVERVKVLKEIERVEVPKYIRVVEEIKSTGEALIIEAKNEPINPAACNLSADRVRRINQATVSGGR